MFYRVEVLNITKLNLGISPLGIQREISPRIASFLIIWYPDHSWTLPEWIRNACKKWNNKIKRNLIKVFQRVIFFTKTYPLLRKWWILMFHRTHLHIKWIFTDRTGSSIRSQQNAYEPDVHHSLNYSRIYIYCVIDDGYLSC